MNQTVVKIMSIGGLVLSVAGMVLTNIATSNAQTNAINDAVNAKIAELTK